MSARLEVTSEIYAETDFHSAKTSDGKLISRFTFTYPSVEENGKDNVKMTKIDSDGDLIVARKKSGCIEIEHLNSTNLLLVGLQVWRGAFVLADFLFHHCRTFANKHILEVGSGVGLSSIAAAVFTTERVICTDIDIGGILNVIRSNVARNTGLTGNVNKVDVMELDFKNSNWPSELQEAMKQTDVVIAADVIYDQDLTDALVQTIAVILDVNSFNANGQKEIYIAMEKRYVFTLTDLDTVAPCYEHFLSCVNREIQMGKPWKLEFIPIDFPQYFIYERVKELILLKLSVRLLC